MTNDYLDEFYELQEESSFRGQQWFGKRKELVERYSWAIPTDEVIQYLSEFKSGIEIGAGNGYWSYLIREAGGSFRPIDIDPPVETYMTVQEKDIYDEIESVENQPVLMVWPPIDNSVAADVAKEKPSHICYVGEQRGGCTATDTFFDIIDKQYGLVGKINIPSYTGIHDNFFHYSRIR